MIKAGVWSIKSKAVAQHSTGKCFHTQASGTPVTELPQISATLSSHVK